MAKILITGGTGLVGTRLTALLQSEGHEVAYLSRKKRPDAKITYFEWDLKKGYIEEGALEWADRVIHLAGAGVADERWTPERKEAIMKSRTESAKLLKSELSKRNHDIRSFIAATAIGWYGDSGSQLMTEEMPPANDFLAKVCQEWEKEIDALTEATGLRTVKIRVGVVLSTQGGALVEIAKPIKLYAGAALGSGKQYQSWIHIEDLCRLFIYAMDNTEMKGIYNGVAPHPITNEELTEAIAKELNKPLILPNVPAFAMKLMLGEMATVVLAGSKVSSEKASLMGFEWDHPHIAAALTDLYRKNI